MATKMLGFGNPIQQAGFSAPIQQPQDYLAFGQPQQQFGYNNPMNTAMPDAGGVGMMGGMFDNMNWGNISSGINAATGVAQAFLGFGQLNEARSQNEFTRNAWQAEYDIQKEQYDRQVSERDARVAANQANSQAAQGTL